MPQRERFHKHGLPEQSQFTCILSAAGKFAQILSNDGEVKYRPFGHWFPITGSRRHYGRMRESSRG